MKLKKDNGTGQKHLIQHLRQAEKRDLPARECDCVVMFIDIVGFSTFASRSTDAQALALVRRFENAARSLIGECGGRVVMTAGDAIMACWRGKEKMGPAARCARRIRERLDAENQRLPRLEKIHIRVGLNCGQVLELQDGDIIGSAVNLACRLQTAAKPGEILLSANAAEIGGDNSAMPERGKIGFMRLKGFDQPVEVFSLSSRRSWQWLKPVTDSFASPLKLKSWSWGVWAFIVAGLLLGMGMAMTSPTSDFPRPRVTAGGIAMLFFGWAVFWAAYRPRTVSLLHLGFRVTAMILWGLLVILGGGLFGCWPC